MKYMSESSLNDSVLFQKFNNNAELTVILHKCITNGTIIDSSYIEEQLLQIKRTRISPLVDNVLKAYEDGDIVIIHSKVSKVPKAIPFSVFKMNGKLKAYIFANNYGTIIDNGEAKGGKYLNIPMKNLYALMEGAYTALEYYQYPQQFQKSLGLMKTCSQIYSAMATRIFNKEFSLSMDREAYNRVSFAVAKFFLMNVWENKNEELATSYAMQSVVNPNKADLLIVNDSYQQANIKTIKDLIDFLKTITPRLNSLNLSLYTQWYISLYKDGALFSMECLPYFLFVAESVLMGSFVVNQAIIYDIMKQIRGTNTFYAELAKII